MNHTETILSFIQDHTEKHGFEPPVTVICKETGITRVNIYKAFKEVPEIQFLKQPRSQQYIYLDK